MTQREELHIKQIFKLYRHKVKGGTYEVLPYPSQVKIGDGWRDAVIYRGIGEVKLWIREKTKFDDKFELI